MKVQEDSSDDMSHSYTISSVLDVEDEVPLAKSGASPSVSSLRGTTMNVGDPKGQDKTVEIVIIALIVIAAIVSAMLVCFIIRRRLFYKTYYPTIPDNFAELDEEEKKATLDLVLKRHADSSRALLTTIRTNSSSDSDDPMEYFDQHNRRRLKKNVWHSTHAIDMREGESFDEEEKEEGNLRRSLSAPNFCSTSFTVHTSDDMLGCDKNHDEYIIGDFNSCELDKAKEYFLPISGESGSIESDDSVNLDNFFDNPSMNNIEKSHRFEFKEYWLDEFDC
ncbi:predicted protein [Chaetoceros tenuissimus]|uniref:Uncharacterized protein n=1 Tax=Chaetoceros tenuissimus TaxID=426638 RepID=A0AAD3CEB2_9STRA|nr:predicted protein [Chaetoceros tenuissimus]